MFDALVRRLSISARIAATAFTFSLLLLFLFPIVGSGYELTSQQIASLKDGELPATIIMMDAANLIASSQLRVAQALSESYAGKSLRSSGALTDLDNAIRRLQEAEKLYGPQAGAGETGGMQIILQSLATLRSDVTAFDTALSAGSLEQAANLAVQARTSGDVARNLIVNLVDERGLALQKQMNSSLGRWNDQFTALVALVVGLFMAALLFALWVARTITRPLARITEAVDAFAQGDMNAVAPASGHDEVSVVAYALNQLFTMFSQMSRVMNQEIEKRTTALSLRAVQLQTVADITRDAAAIPELENLLTRSADLVRDRFDFYFVGIFLLDPEGRYAILRAGSGEVGRILKSRSFRLRVGEANIVGLVSQSGEERIVNDVEMDFTFLREPLLPLTRSESVLPLKVGGGRIIGALDVQSAVRNTFDRDTLSVLQILADQLAVVIENSRLGAALAQAEQEAGTLLQRYTQETWRSQTALQRAPGYLFDLIDIQPYTPSSRPQIAAALVASRSGSAQVVPLETGGSLLRAPLIMHNQIVGVIGLEEEDPNRVWTEDEVRILEALTTQISLAMENARLLDEAQRRTNQLRLLQEVTASAAAHTELEALLTHVTRTMRAEMDLDFAGAFLFTGRIAGYGAVRARYSATRNPDPRLEPLETLSMDAHSQPAVRALQDSGRSQMVNLDRDIGRFGDQAARIVKAGFNGILLVPILYRGQVVGLLDLYTGAAELLLFEENLRLMDQVALQLASAVEVAMSFTQTTRRAERERHLVAVVQRIRETLDIPTILRTAAEEIRGSLVREAGAQVDAAQQTEVIVRLGSTPDAGRAQPEHSEGEAS